MSITPNATAPRPRAVTAQETADRLMSVAQAAFAQAGFAAVSLDALAAEAGVTRGALHHRFGNKAGLFEAVLRRIVAEIGAEMEEVTATAPDPWAACVGCFHHYLDAVLRPDRARILFQDAPSVMGVQAMDILLEDGFGELVADLRDHVAQGRIAPADPVALAHMLNGATLNLAFWVAEAPPGDPRAADAHRTLDVLFQGIGRKISGNS
ncbi:MAG: TetR/AcrR family transcriptional regulator [Gemmobacter sp.]